MFSRISFNAKLYLTLALMWVGLLVVGVGSALDARQRLFDERLAAIDHVLDVATAIATSYQERAARGAMSADDAKKAVIAEWSLLHFRKNGYVYAATFDNTLLLNPGKPEQVGKDMSAATDAAGNHPYVDLAKVAETKERGFITAYDKDKDGALVEKVSAVRRVAGWNWYVAARLYVEDLNTEFEAVLLRQAAYIVGAGAVMTALMIFIIRSINRSMGGDPVFASSVANRIADGDLTVSVDADAAQSGSLLSAMDRMTHSLSATLLKIREGTAAISVGAQQIAAGNADLSVRTSRSSTALESTTNSLAELTTTVSRNADNAREVSHLAAEAAELASQGQQAVVEVATTMSGIRASSAQVGDMLNLIESIAFQTNLLALNAAVEAARAGQHGRGFAVVASEVRALAQRTADAAKDIKRITADSSQRVQEGDRQVVRAGEVMGDIVSGVKRVSQLIAEIASGSQEQTAGISDINRVVGELDQSTQQNASLVQQSEAAAASLNVQVDQLQSLVARFTIA